MVRRGVKPKGKVKLKWSANFAYAIGLLVTDGNISQNGRHILFVSKDMEQIENYMKALEIKMHVGTSLSGSTGNRTPRVQFGDVLFHAFLRSIGLMPNKTKIIGEVIVPVNYFFDFLRGHLDGDGCTYSYFDPRWKTSFLFYTTFLSASKTHIDWLREEIYKRTGSHGHISTAKKSSVYQLRYAKKDSIKLLKKIYYNPTVLCLSRKRLKIEKAFSIVGERL